MERDLSQETAQMRQTAQRLIRCLGSQGALDYCATNHWQGLYREIQALAGSIRARLEH